MIPSNTHTHTHPFNGPFSGTTRVSRYQKGKTNLDFTEVRDSEWQWHQLGHMHVCISLHTEITTPAPHHSSFLQAGCASCIKALKIPSKPTDRHLYKLESSHRQSHHVRTHTRIQFETKEEAVVFTELILNTKMLSTNSGSLSKTTFSGYVYSFCAYV